MLPAWGTPNGSDFVKAVVAAAQKALGNRECSKSRGLLSLGGLVFSRHPISRTICCW